MYVWTNGVSPMINTILATILQYMTTHSLALCIAGLQSHIQLSNINIQFNSIQVLSAKCANVKAYNTKKKTSTKWFLAKAMVFPSVQAFGNSTSSIIPGLKKNVNHGIGHLEWPIFTCEMRWSNWPLKHLDLHSGKRLHNYGKSPCY